MTHQKRQFNLDKIKSSKTRHILKEAITVAEQLDEGGCPLMAGAIDRLIRSRIAAITANKLLTKELHAALRQNKEAE